VTGQPIETGASETTEPTQKPRRSGPPRAILIVAGLVLVVVIDYLAAVFVPPFPKGGQAGQACDFPTCFVNGNIEVPAPKVIWGPPLDPAQSINFQVSLSSTILTSWLVMAAILIVFLLAVRRVELRPGRLQNAVEYVFEALSSFAESVGGPAIRGYIPLFAAFFLFILVSNWSGLVPPVGKLDLLRAPTSDLNVTLGLALTSFAFFEFQGFRQLGVRGYLGKFLPLGEFRHGIGSGILALFVGLIELFLEFVKPITLSMRLFGNIFGGEVALGVITGLTIAIVPVLMFGLDFLLNFIQALIFSTLTLVFTMLAVEGHASEDHAPAKPEQAGGAAIGVHSVTVQSRTA
jgi:F-type H+-transporting ATPase subunit a